MDKITLADIVMKSVEDAALFLEKKKHYKPHFRVNEDDAIGHLVLLRNYYNAKHNDDFALRLVSREVLSYLLKVTGEEKAEKSKLISGSSTFKSLENYEQDEEQKGRPIANEGHLSLRDRIVEKVSTISLATTVVSSIAYATVQHELSFLAIPASLIYAASMVYKWRKNPKKIKIGESKLNALNRDLKETDFMLIHGILDEKKEEIKPCLSKLESYL